MTQTIGVILGGVTGRVGTNQHLRSILEIRQAGGVLLADGERVMPEPLLLGRDSRKLQALAEPHGFAWSTNLESALADPTMQIYHDAQVSQQRPESVKRAILAGKHVYCEKPLAQTPQEALELAQLADEKNVQHGAIQNMLFLPGVQKLKHVINSGFFGRILNIRLEFGYWVFEGDWQASQRPSWNYRSEDGGGLLLDMFPHFHYLLEELFAPIRTLTALTSTQIPERFDENGKAYTCTSDDTTCITLELEGGIVAQIHASWASRVYRDDMFSLQVDGTHGSAVIGYGHCKVQHRISTPRPVWNPSATTPDYRLDWHEIPDQKTYLNPFRAQWEHFLGDVASHNPHPWNFHSAARGIQIAHLCLKSALERRWLTIPQGDVHAQLASTAVR